MMKSYNVFSAKENTLIGFSHPIRILTMVGLVGLEPMTSTMSRALAAPMPLGKYDRHLWFL